MSTPWTCGHYCLGTSCTTVTARIRSSGPGRPIDRRQKVSSSPTRPGGPTCWTGAACLLLINSRGNLIVVSRYLDDEFIITLPGNKRITEIKWFSVYDLTSQSAYGDIYIPDGFQPPGYQVF